jgi:hypothetical protein
MASNIELFIVCIIFVLIILFRNKKCEKFEILKNNSNININITNSNNYDPFNYAYYFPYNNPFFRNFNWWH